MDIVKLHIDQYGYPCNDKGIRVRYYPVGPPVIISVAGQPEKWVDACILLLNEKASIKITGYVIGETICNEKGVHSAVQYYSNQTDRNEFIPFDFCATLKHSD